MTLPIDLPKILAIVRRIAMEAGKVIMDIYESDFSVELKNDKSPLTPADIAANQMIVEALRTNFPYYAILSEESKDDINRLDNDHCFIVDPLDGTKEFIHRNGEFTINIALAHQNKAVLGVVYAPVLQHLYYAYKGGSAFFEDGKVHSKRPLHVSDRTDHLIALRSRSHSQPNEVYLFEKHKHQIDCVISMGSSLKGCLIAAGEADIYYRFGLTSEWDTAAMQCVVEEAGGIFLQTDGTPMRYNRKDILNRLGFCVLNRADNIWI